MRTRLAALIAAAAVVPTASADYTLGITGRGADGQHSPQLFVQPGQSFTGLIVLAGAPGDTIDAATLRLESTAAGLEFSPGWFTWADPFTTGGIDDLSVPASGAGGMLTIASFLDPAEPDSVDAYFDNLTDSFGEFFGSGELITLTLTIPASWEPTEFLLRVEPISFASAGDAVTVQAGGELHVVVIPAPGMTAAGPVVVALLAVRRRRTQTGHSNLPGERGMASGSTRLHT